MKLIVDARYTRIGFHDGISRFTSSLLTALKELMETEHPAAEGLEVVMAISDPRQLHMLPELPYVKICSPTGPLEPFASIQLNRFRPDVVFSPMQTIGSLGRKFKLVLTLHDLIYYAHPTPPSFLPKPVQWGWRIFHKSFLPQRLLLNRADAVATVSQTTAGLIRRHRLTRQPLFVVPNAPVSNSLISLEAALKSAPSRTKQLIYMGSFMPYKNVETLIGAMRLLPDYTLHLLSKIQPARRAELEKIAGANVVFENGVSDERYAQLLAESAALLTASQDEGYGLPVVEAQAAGCPAVISNIEIFREIAPHALHCSPDSAEEFAAAVRSLEDSDVQRQVIATGLEDAAAFSWQDSALKLLNLIKNLS